MSEVQPADAVAVHPPTPGPWPDLEDVFGHQLGANSGSWCIRLRVGTALYRDILDCGTGPSSFAVEMPSLDPLDAGSAENIGSGLQRTQDAKRPALRQRQDRFDWDFYRWHRAV
jgi:hypothetical protein